MPPPPELLDRFGDIGQVEILLEGEAEHPAQADGHVAVAGEIEVDLQGVTHRPQPGQPQVQLPRRHGEHRVRHPPGGVGQQQLFGKARDEPPQPRQGQLRRQGPAVDLPGHVVVLDDGPRDELGKKGDVQQQPAQAFGARVRVPVHVQGVAQPLEGEKGDADGQGQPRQGDGQAEGGVQGGGEEVQVFERPQQEQIGRHGAGGGPALPPPGGGHHQPPEEIVEDHAQQQQGQVHRLAEGVEHQAGQGQPQIPGPHPRQEAVDDVGNGQEPEQKDG